VKTFWITCLLCSIPIVAGCQRQIQSEEHGPESEHFEVYPIGTVKKEGERTFVVLDKEFEPGLKGLERHSYVHVVYWFDRNDTPAKRAILQVHPRGEKNNPLTGVFATHSPFRP